MTYSTEGPAPSGPLSIGMMDAFEPAERLTLTEPTDEGICRIAIGQADLALLSLEGLNPDVHAVRKAMKRIRGLLRMVRSSIGDHAYRLENDVLRNAGRVLAPARDATASIESFDAVVAQHPRCLDLLAEEAIRLTLIAEEWHQQRSLATDPDALPGVVAALTGVRTRVTNLSASSAQGAAAGGFDLIGDGLRRTYRRCRRDHFAVMGDPSGEAFHRWRKTVKHLRHQLETLVAYSPEMLGCQVDELDALGELLGSAQDLAVLSHALSRFADGRAERADRPIDLLPLLAAIADDLEQLRVTSISMGETMFASRPRLFVTPIRAAFDKPEHIQLARDIYGIDSCAQPLPSELDDIARIDAVGGDRYVMRISPQDADTAALDLIAAAMDAAADDGIPVPRAVESTGRDIRTILDDGRIVRMHTWLPGGARGSAGISGAVAESIGGTAGDLVNALSRLPQPDRPRTEPQWDLAHAPTTISGLLPHLPDDVSRTLIGEALIRIERIAYNELPRQVIHNDLNPENLLFHDDRVVGVIDFGDTTWTVRIGELAIACAYAMLDQDDPVDIGTTIAGAYGRTATVTPAEAEWLFDLIVARLAMSACIADSRTHANPHHQNTSEGVWNLLATLLAADTPWIAERLAAACLGESLRADPSATVRVVASRTVLGPSLSLSYADPLHIVRGHGAFLFDAGARRYLDGVNNVAHVGHAHPTVVDAARRQASTLNTNTRYLHPEVLRYASRLTETLPDGLDTVFLVNSGSEANELAIRIAMAANGHTGLACLDDAYHGNTSLLIDVSPYKFNGPGGQGRREGISVLPSPDPYRYPERGGDGAGARYRHVADEALRGSRPAALIAEALPGCGGQVVPAPGVIAAAYGAMRDRGGVVIADEVQTGLGRVGTHFWAFQLHGVVPDIVTIGKPAGNGHPLAAVVTTSALGSAFDTGMEYFNTFGGNPVSAAVGNAVLDVIEDERLQARARIAGTHLRSGLANLMETQEAIGDVRGAGLFIGIELVSDRQAKEPDADLATAVVELAKAKGVLLSADGPHRNVIKIKPPLVVTAEDCDRIVTTVDAALTAMR